MKNRIILLSILLITSFSQAYAGQEPKVISDEADAKKTIEAFADLNRNTDRFFTPVITKEMRKKMEEKNAGKPLETRPATDPYNYTITGKTVLTPNRGSVLPVRKLRIMWQERNAPKAPPAEVAEVKDQAVLDCDVMEYFADRTELEATGNVVVVFPQNESGLRADKLVYNQTSNMIKAYGNVVLVHKGQEMYGDFMQIDMNEENAFMEKPHADVFQIRSRAQKGYMYGDKLIQENGDLLVTKKTWIKVRNETFGPDLDRMYVDEFDKSAFKKDSHGEVFKIKTRDLILNSKSEHDNVTLKHAEVYYKGKKVGTIPSITIHSNKAQDYAEADYPELGMLSNIGFYAGPGFVFDTPMGTNLKLVPMFNSDAGVNGFGGIAKFKSATNKVDIGYGTANKIFVARGKQRLDDKLYIQYGANSYMDDWFMGFRMPGLMSELVYEDSYIKGDFIGKDLPLMYTHRVAAGYMQDYDGQGRMFRTTDDNTGIGTTRFKYMAEVAQTIYQFNGNDEKFFLSNLKRNEAIQTRLEAVFQGAATVYGTGDTQMVARFGPRLHTQYRYWMQDAGYFLSAYDDKSPLVNYDRYVYGRSNVYLRETVRLNKYLALSWFGSFNLSNDSPNGELFQENSFYFSLGPDDIKFHVGYDTVRQQSFVSMAVALDAKGSNIEYKKMVIKNPDKLGKDKDGNNINSQSFTPTSSPFGSDEDEEQVEKAEVINM